MSRLNPLYDPKVQALTNDPIYNSLLRYHSLEAQTPQTVYVSSKPSQELSSRLDESSSDTCSVKPQDPLKLINTMDFRDLRYIQKSSCSDSFFGISQLRTPHSTSLATRMMASVSRVSAPQHTSVPTAQSDNTALFRVSRLNQKQPSCPNRGYVVLLGRYKSQLYVQVMSLLAKFLLR
ncbi:unnamed protein product [Protopolystoma xenopodis]|uniref:Uncharacterized protein n=1 Tax=Protopolystoma xenopodis TaxID=117903 RepID=A0A3S5CJQ2_9PLAT|nr:unnamed protein product [Protopolystoma xenopodis]